MRIELMFTDGRSNTVVKNVAAFYVSEDEEPDIQRYRYLLTKTPTEEHKLFEVDLNGIDFTLFQDKREDPKQEEARKLILEAKEEFEQQPRLHPNTKFYTMRLRETWYKNEIKHVGNLDKIAKQLGGYVGDWAEQALEWAQRISNGENWNTICNYSDNATTYRVVRWKDGNLRVVGGNSKTMVPCPPSHVSSINYRACRDATIMPFVVFDQRL
jgi:hypothetical protein